MGQSLSALLCWSDSAVDDTEPAPSRGPEGLIVGVSDPGAVLGFEGAKFNEHYKLGPEIGKGAYSTVREAKFNKTEKQYAVKCMKRANLPPDDEADLFTEVSILRSLKHPNIINIFQLYKDDPEYFYVVEEFMKGGELFDRIVQKSFYNEKEARDLCRILLDSIKYCHDKNIVHRDLKPENLLMTSESDDATIKLADFGFARSLDSGLLTTQCGTPGYVAPEIIKGEPYGKSVDLWSIGVILYILLGGYPPFHDENQRRLFRKIKSGSFKFHAEYWKGTSNEAKDLIRRMLNVDTTKRITAAEAVVHPWLLSKEVDLAKRNLDKNLQQLRLFNARRKLRGAINSIIFQKRLGGMVDLMS